MNDKQKIASLKQKSLDENEAKYGLEIRTKYGKTMVEQTNAQFKNMDSATFDRAQKLATEIIETLKMAMEQGDESSALAQKACAMHHEWLLIYWPKYEKAMHRALGDMYVQDERFTAYYDQFKQGMAQFLRNGIHIYAK